MVEGSRCPQEVENAILEIFKYSALSIRAYGWDDKAEQCALLADHIHNLPDLLKNYQPRLLDYYWNIERTSFLRQAKKLGFSSEIFKEQWDRIEPHVANPQKEN